MENNRANYWIEKLNLSSHPEGGWFKETYRSVEIVEKAALPDRFAGKRHLSTAIYYLLEKGDFSAFHRIKSDEMWHYYAGEPLQIIEINVKGELINHLLGIDEKIDCLPQVLIPAGSWFASRPLGKYTLVGCTVSPGFDFTDFEMANCEELVALYREYDEIIKELCKR